MRQTPDVLVRIDDGEKFVRNADGSYELEFMIREFPKSLRMSYAYDHLMKSRAFREMTPTERATGVIVMPPTQQDRVGSAHGDPYDE